MYYLVELKLKTLFLRKQLNSSNLSYNTENGSLLSGKMIFGQTILNSNCSLQIENCERRKKKNNIIYHVLSIKHGEGSIMN